MELVPLDASGKKKRWTWFHHSYKNDTTPSAN